MRWRYRGIMLMGVSSSGKSMIGRMLAERLGWEFLEADDFHSLENRQKISSAIPLSEHDRMDRWIPDLADQFGGRILRRQPTVLAFSGLKRRYRDAIPLDWHVGRFFLFVTPRVAQQRAHRRAGHIAKAEFVRTQFADVQWPEPDERVVIIDAEAEPETILRTLMLNAAAEYPDPRAFSRGDVASE